jgi:hypothetical protein
MHALRAVFHCQMRFGKQKKIVFLIQEKKQQKKQELFS